MSEHSFLGLDPPRGKYLDIMKYVLKRDGGVRKKIDLCCGLGFGKTLLLIQIAALTLNSSPKHRGLFLEPDHDRTREIFLAKWLEHVPPELYEIDLKRSLIRWYNGATLLFRPRVISGSRAAARNKKRGIEFTFVIDDEAADGFDLQFYQNTFARIRADAPVRFYLTASTPMPGPYVNFIKRGGNRLFQGKTSENFYLLRRDPDYEKDLRAEMSPEQAKRELDGEMIALEGRVWPSFSLEDYPHGNMHDAEWDPSMPWALGMDIGQGFGHWQIWQAHVSNQHDMPVYVVVAEGQQKGPIQTVLDVLQREYVEPSDKFPYKIGIGIDASTMGAASLGAGAVLNQWGFKNWQYPGKAYREKFIQHQVASSLVRDGMGVHLCLSKKMRRHGPTNEPWGMKNMFLSDQYTDAGAFAKDKGAGVGASNVEDPRDSLMYLSVAMRQPRWVKTKARAV